MAVSLTHRHRGLAVLVRSYNSSVDSIQRVAMCFGAAPVA